jgi:hypothetical protein
MAVKMLTTKKHTKTAKSITKIKEANKPIEVAKPIKVVAKRKLKRPMLRVGQSVTMQEYLDAKLIVKQYEKENPKENTSPIIFINLIDKLDRRTINGVVSYFKNKGVNISPNKIEKSKLKQIDLYEISFQRNFGKSCIVKLTEFLDNLK